MLIFSIWPMIMGIGVIIGTSLCANGRIKPNYFIGIRLPQVMKTEQTWEAGHTAAMFPVTVGGMLAVVIGLGTELIPAIGIAGPILALVSVLVGLAWAVTRALAATKP
jgi:hypothetical protein